MRLLALALQVALVIADFTFCVSDDATCLTSAQSTRYRVVRCVGSSVSAPSGAYLSPGALETSPLPVDSVDLWPYLSITTIQKSVSSPCAEGGAFMTVDTDKPMITAVGLLMFPMTHNALSGSYWNRQEYWYVFAILCGTLSLLYALFARLRAWQTLLVLSVAAFAAVAANTIYQAADSIGIAITYSHQVSFMEGFIATAVMGFAVNFVPAFVAMLVMRYGRCRPVAWSTLGVVTAAAALLAGGAGWYAGPSLLALGSFVRILQHYC